MGKNGPRWLIDGADKMEVTLKPKVNAFVFVSVRALWQARILAGADYQ